MLRLLFVIRHLAVDDRNFAMLRGFLTAAQAELSRRRRSAVRAAARPVWVDLF